MALNSDLWNLSAAVLENVRVEEFKGATTDVIPPVCFEIQHPQCPPFFLEHPVFGFVYV
jgi:hypothetical protein